MREQTACNGTVRLRWELAEDTYVCVQDEDMARIVALTGAAGVTLKTGCLIGADFSADAGRRSPWKPLDLGKVTR